MQHIRFGAAILTMAAALTASSALATTLKLARSGDALTMDPHAAERGADAQSQPPDLRAAGAPAHRRRADPDAGDQPGRSPADPTVWEFKLRAGVKFHDGTPFTADDVVFSLKRAGAPTSDHKGLLDLDRGHARSIDLTTVHIKTKGPNPLLVQNLTNLFMMSKAWCEKNKVEAPQNFANKEETFAVRNANGTGAYMLVSREPDVKTVMKRNEAYWGKGTYPLEVSEIVYTVIKSAPTRVAALLSGEIDFVQDMPVQDIARVAGTQGLRVNAGPENRTIFLGMNIGDPELKFSDVKGKNPFADLKVRQAMNMAIDREAIRKVVMADQSVPGGSIIPPFVNGYTKELDAIPPRDVAKAKALMAEAGYPPRLRRHAALPERPLPQRREDLPGRGRHARPDRHQGDARCALEVDPLPADPEEGSRLLPARLGRSDLRQRVHLLVPLPHAEGQARRLERHALLERWRSTPRSSRSRRRPISTKRNKTIAEIWAVVQPEPQLHRHPQSGERLGHEGRSRRQGASRTTRCGSRSSSSRSDVRRPAVRPHRRSRAACGRSRPRELDAHCDDSHAFATRTRLPCLPSSSAACCRPCS